MRSMFGFALVCLIGSAALAQQKTTIRFQVTSDPNNYPQETVKDALNSVIRAINRNRFEYLVAHLLDPAFVDDRIAATRSTPDQFIKMIQANLAEDPDLLRDLKRFIAEGEIQEGGESATVKHKDVKDKTVFMKKIGDRWFMENRRHTKE